MLYLCHASYTHVFLMQPDKAYPPHPIIPVACLLLLALRVVVACIGGSADLGDLRCCWESGHMLYGRGGQGSTCNLINLCG